MTGSPSSRPPQSRIPGSRPRRLAMASLLTPSAKPNPRQPSLPTVGGRAPHASRKAVSPGGGRPGLGARSRTNRPTAPRWAWEFRGKPTACLSRNSRPVIKAGVCYKRVALVANSLPYCTPGSFPRTRPSLRPQAQRLRVAPRQESGQQRKLEFS
jgi:hypothetical protein